MRFLLLAVCLCLLVAVECRKRRRPGRVLLRRCRLGEPCYPSQGDICKLRKHLNGKLLVPSDADYRNAVLMRNRRTTGYPGMVIQAMSIKDVKYAMKFARKYNLEVSIKYDDLDPIGRPTNDGGMMLDMSTWKSISHVVTSARSPAGEVTVNAGDSWGDIFAYVDTITTLRADNSVERRLISGSMYNKESAGSFTQSGGIGPLARNLGLASDNLLEATIVTVSGKLVKVSPAGVHYMKESGWSHEYKNTDLFYAIRGGGSGTFGVILTLTFKLHIAPNNMNQISFSHTLHQNGQFVGRDALKKLLIDAKTLDNVFGVTVTALSGNRADPSLEGSIQWDMLQSFDVSSPFSGIANNFLTYNSSGTLISNGLQIPRLTYLDFSSSVADLVPGNGYFVNTFIQHDVVDDSEKLDQLADIFLSVVNKPTVNSLVSCVGTLLGGAISSTPASTAPVNPLLRSAFMMVTCGVMWPENSDYDGETFRDAADTLADKMKEVGQGVYFNSANEDLEGWKTAIYGRNYRKLVDVKRWWDPDNFLYCESCVGSDFRFDCFDNIKMDGMHLSSYLYYSSCGNMFKN